MFRDTPCPMPKETRESILLSLQKAIVLVDEAHNFPQASMFIDCRRGIFYAWGNSRQS
jgi:hypothetical protein